MKNTESSPDLIDLIFKYIEEEFPEVQDRISDLKPTIRKEFSGIETYIRQRSMTDRENQIREVMSLFNGRNATEVARRLNISRATVYRCIKTSAR